MVKPHVAFLPSPGLGHVTPLLELAKRLVTHHDVHVSFLVITTTEPSAAQDLVLQSPNLPRGINVVYLSPVDVAAVTIPDMQLVTRISAIAEDSLVRSLESTLLELGKPQALIIDLFCTKAFEICSELPIPVYSFSTPSTWFLAFVLYLPTLDREVECEFVELPEPIRIPGCTELRPEDVLVPVQKRKTDECNWFLLHMSRLPLAAGIFVNTWDDLEKVSLKALREDPFFQQIPTPPIYPVGPLIKQEELLTEQDHECLTWLDKQPSNSVIFVALGSGGTLSSEQLTELAYGLELSQQRFIWVARKPTDATGSGTYFNVGSDVNDPKAYLPEGFVERTKGVGLVVPSWAPQVAVLSHPSTGGFLSHCGWNSSLESIVHGVPMLAWPLYAEQRMNATMLAEEVGVAVKVEVGPGKGIVGREEIEGAVRKVLAREEGEEMRRRARELKESAAKALGIGGSSYDALASVVTKWKMAEHEA